MTYSRRTILAALICSQLARSVPACGQEEVEQTREEWLTQIERARQRVEQIRRDGKFVEDEDQSVNEMQKEVARRALEDDQLQPGDVVSTERGLVRFDGVAPDNKRIFVPLDSGSR